MLTCWKMDPTERPTFSQLVVSLSGMLDQLAGYFDLNGGNYASSLGGANTKEGQQKENPSLTLEDQSGQPSENVSLLASALPSAPSEDIEFVTSAINLTEDERYIRTPVSGTEKMTN